MFFLFEKKNIFREILGLLNWKIFWNLNLIFLKYLVWDIVIRLGFVLFSYKGIFVIKILCFCDVGIVDIWF